MNLYTLKTSEARQEKKMAGRLSLVAVQEIGELISSFKINIETF